jgi:hypothetical protein
MGVAPGRLLREALGSVAILAALVAVAGGLPALDRALPALRDLPAGEAYAVGGGVLLVPPPGARLDAGLTRPYPDRGVAVFVVGRVRMAVQVSPFTGDLPAAGERLRARLSRTAGQRLDGPAEPLGTAWPGLTGRYAPAAGDDAQGRTGRYAVLTGAGHTVEVTAAGPPAALADTWPAVVASLDTLRSGG